MTKLWFWVYHITCGEIQNKQQELIINTAIRIK